MRPRSPPLDPGHRPPFTLSPTVRLNSGGTSSFNDVPLLPPIRFLATARPIPAVDLYPVRQRSPPLDPGRCPPFTLSPTVRLNSGGTPSFNDIPLLPTPLFTFHLNHFSLKPPFTFHLNHLSLKPPFTFHLNHLSLPQPFTSSQIPRTSPDRYALPSRLL
jgi:hypothetical protein